MAKRSVDVRYSQRVEENVVSEIKSQTQATVRLVLLRDNHLFIRGPVTGKQYEFVGVGSIQDVDEVDANEMLQIEKDRYSCCSGMKTSPLFEIAR